MYCNMIATTFIHHLYFIHPLVSCVCMHLDTLHACALMHTHACMLAFFYQMYFAAATETVYDGTIKRGNNPPSSTLYVEGLSYSTTESKLKEVFEGCIGIRIIKEFGKSRG